MKNMYKVAFDLAKEGKKVLLVGIDSSKTKLYRMLLDEQHEHLEGDINNEIKKMAKEVSKLHEQGTFDFMSVDWRESFYDLESQVLPVIRGGGYDVVVLDSHKNTIELFVDKIQEINKVDVRHPNEFRFDNIEEVFGDD